MADRPDLVIGIDCSTTSCKAVVWDKNGNPVHEGRVSLVTSLPKPAWHEQDAVSWWQAASTALREAINGIDTTRLAGLCITHQRETFVAVDECGRPLRPAILWMDERCHSLLPDLAQRIGKDTVQVLTGKPLTGNLVIGKIEWLSRNEPETVKKVWKYLDVQAYLVACLTRRYRTGWGSADPLGVFEMETNRWSEGILGAIGARVDQFPEAFSPGSWLGEVSPAAAAISGLPAGLPVFAGIGDGQSAGLGMGIFQPGAAYLSLGTSVITGTFSQSYRVSPAFRTMVGGLPGSYLFETVLLGGTYTISWFLDQFCSQLEGSEGQEKKWAAQAEMEQLAAAIPPGSQGLMLVPYWNSAMNPYWDSSASGIVVGWRGIHTRAHLYRAIMEGIAFELHLHMQGVEQALGSPVTRLVATGGGSRSRQWLQIIASATGIPVWLSSTAEAAALGAGILAAGGSGLYPGIGQAAEAMTHSEKDCLEPDEKQARIYRSLFDEVYVKLFPALQEPLNRLADLTG